jgi:hypothetical protein
MHPLATTCRPSQHQQAEPTKTIHSNKKLFDKTKKSKFIKTQVEKPGFFHAFTAGLQRLYRVNMLINRFIER